MTIDWEGSKCLTKEEYSSAYTHSVRIMALDAVAQALSLARHFRNYGSGSALTRFDVSFFVVLIVYQSRWNIKLSDHYTNHGCDNFIK